MLRKLVLRLLRIAGAAVCLLLTSLAIVGYLAMQEPGFYSAAMAGQATLQEVAAATQSLEEQRAAYLIWRSQLMADPARGRDRVVPKPFEIRYTDKHLNTLLASEITKIGDGTIEDPRVGVTQGRVEFACGVRTPAGRCVLSAEMTPSLTPDGVLTLDLESTHLGYLPLPSETLLGFLPRKKERLSGNLYLDLTAPKLRLTLDLSDKAGAFMADSIECADGELVVRFVARPQAE